MNISALHIAADVPRKLAARPIMPGHGLTGWAASGRQVLTEDQVRDALRAAGGTIDYRPLGVPTLDQGQHGSCVGHGWVGGLMTARAINGLAKLLLSPTYLYALINGGVDDGAAIDDGATALESRGTVAMAAFGEGLIYARQITAAVEAGPHYKLAQAYVSDDDPSIDPWLVYLTGIVTGCLPVMGLQVSGRRDFNTLDPDGCAPINPGAGDHCTYGSGAALLPSGEVVGINTNSWSDAWPPRPGRFGPGRFGIRRGHLTGYGDQPSVCLLDVPGLAPGDPAPPGVPTS